LVFWFVFDLGFFLSLSFLHKGAKALFTYLLSFLITPGPSLISVFDPFVLEWHLLVPPFRIFESFVFRIQPLEISCRLLFGFSPLFFRSGISFFFLSGSALARTFYSKVSPPLVTEIFSSFFLCPHVVGFLAVRYPPPQYPLFFGDNLEWVSFLAACFVCWPLYVF